MCKNNLFIKNKLHREENDFLKRKKKHNNQVRYLLIMLVIFDHADACLSSTMSLSFRMNNILLTITILCKQF